MKRVPERRSRSSPGPGRAGSPEGARKVRRAGPDARSAPLSAVEPAAPEGPARVSRWLAPLRLVSLVTLVLPALSVLPRVSGNPRLAGAFWAATGVLVLLQLALRRSVARHRRVLRYEFVPLPVHYVQAAMQSCVYAYWGQYWPEVQGHVPLILAQIAFAYALDMLIAWLRRDDWVLGFGPFPIVLSTNLFLWFRDDWFALQFALVATGVLGKQFVQWTRDGRRTHVFNPSAFSLFLFSLGLLATGSTGITWGPEIAATLGRPPRIYLEIFLVGLVVQALFSVTLVTLSAAATLWLLNLAYTGWTGTYHFVVTNVPVAVFLGLHLLVTDPATSPRTTLGRLLFGAMYGAGTCVLFAVLGALGLPTFYDKLLPVPPLNLTVRWLDRASRALAARAAALGELPPRAARRLNWGAIAAWVGLFSTMTATGFLAADHPGRDPRFWRRACEEGRPGACRTWARLLDFFCERGDGSSCLESGALARDGTRTRRDPAAAAKRLARACDLGLQAGCDALEGLVRSDGIGALERPCEGGDGESCFFLAELVHYGVGVPREAGRSVGLYRLSCDEGWARGCGRLGQIYLEGDGVAQDPARAVESFEAGCRGGHAASCAAAAEVYRRTVFGLGNEDLARERLRRACDLGLAAACEPGTSPARAHPTVDAETELLKLGG